MLKGLKNTRTKRHKTNRLVEKKNTQSNRVRVAPGSQSNKKLILGTILSICQVMLGPDDKEIYFCYNKK